jgi:short-chain fatty acids transporter
MSGEQQADEAAGAAGAPERGFFAWLSRVCEHYVPDAITMAIVLMVVLVAASIAIDLGDGMGVAEAGKRVVDAYHRGLWMLLEFTMQMTLVLVLSLVLAQTAAFRLVISAVSRLPSSPGGVIATAALLTATISYISWGLSLALAPMIAIHFCKQADRRGIKVDFLWLMAVLAGAGSIWQFGISASGPLMMAASNHFLVGEGVAPWPLATTIFTPAAMAMVLVFTGATVLVGWLFMPRNVKPITHFPESDKLAEAALGAELTHAEVHPAPHTLAKRIEHSNLTLLPLIVGLAAWLYYQLWVVEGGSFELKSLITWYLLACLVLHRNIFRFTNALQEVVVSAWPIIIMYHLYAGVAGLIQYTSVGTEIAQAIEPFANRWTYPGLTAAISTVIAIFLPSSGTQWTIQGLITIRTAVEAGFSGQAGLLALSIGDHMGNLVTPFWAVVGAGIARVEFRQFFGYRLVFAVLWFTTGVLIMTLVPMTW